MTAPAPNPAPVSPLDRPLARGIAVVIALLAMGALAAIHRDDFFPPESQGVPAADDPFQICLKQRVTDIDMMLADGVIKEDQAVRFKANAEALCRDQTGGNAPPPRQ